MNLYKQHPIQRAILYTFLVLLALLCITPFYMMIINSTRSNVEISRNVWLTPGDQLIRNYQIIQSRVNIWQGFYNSMAITVPSIVLAAFFSSMTAYGFAKFKFKGRELLFWIVLGTMMIPQQLGLIGYYDLVARMGLLDTFAPLILPMIANAGMVFFIRAYIEQSISDSLIEAAVIDGAGEFYIFYRLIIPLAMPAIATMSMFTFIVKWNDLITPMVLLHSMNKFPMPLVISNIRGLYETNYGAIYLGVTISILPILLVVIFFSKAIIRGLTIGAVKG
ncbi:carbohydrate ABC transporter permease [Spirochaeta africana]|uniref:ABC-type sugar transport system, permease component n=1 Tax=Spirochaeta africana (strain ATCC 700263 / DSM 8902 / Z-7692) TaxID=889378 RepID=H9UIW5_SPIAZ|nr:carbohydrate ABC transporter permease [Spirochaeta africana]AFG37458.1 ABC-type sugar transport system, permease component [Spirochaeta africana DSM 8902]